MMPMKVQLIVVQGKPEGKVIPLTQPIFKIGRGETCNLRPSSDQVSREHAEFRINGDTVSVRDLGSRNGTLVNGKALTGPAELKDRDLVQVGPLTFAVAIEGGSQSSTKTPVPTKAASPDDVSHDDIDSWLVSDANGAVPERPSGVYRGETITINAFKNEGSPEPAPAKGAPPKAAAPAKPAPPPAEDEVEYERLPEGDGDEEPETETMESEDEATDEMPEEFIDESNPFYVKKKAEPVGPAKPAYENTSDAANDILKKMMERRRSSKA